MICPLLSVKFGTGDRVCLKSECQVYDLTMNDCALKVLTGMKWKLWEEYIGKPKVKIEVRLDPEFKELEKTMWKDLRRKWNGRSWMRTKPKTWEESMKLRPIDIAYISLVSLVTLSGFLLFALGYWGLLRMVWRTLLMGD